MTFKALLIEEKSDSTFEKKVRTVSSNILKINDNLIKVHYSSLNYKDALVARGHKGISREYPTIPGVDAIGEIVESKNGSFSRGEIVIVTGHDLGMNTPGGFSEYISVPDNWIIPLPKELSEYETMVYGTAGVTAGICIHEILFNNIKPESGKILVTGATGGVGSMAIAILAKLGYDVIASTGKKESHEFLNKIGAKQIISREEVLADSKRPLNKARWIAAIDNVGGQTLSSIISSTGQHGLVCSIGLVGSDKFSSTVYPFILRGIRLIGIDSAERGLEIKKDIWKHLATDWKPDNLSEMAKTVKLDEIIPEIEKILKGKQMGKIVVDCQ
ncbi:YhdH/YhfP family quinone oxidoreductase [Candidatus Kapabacteria bacterium]|nr:YhdH/YhfP family quinone oxidoreductase [Candidatus Kapabacteria bacterium]